MRKVDPEKHDQKRREILAAAERCFARSGFQGASISEIRAAAGISSGHLYHYFASKEEIVKEIAELRLKAGIEAMEAILTGPDPLAAFLQHFCRPKPGGADSGYLLLELLAEADRNPAIGTMIREHSARGRRLLADLVRRGQADGKLDAALDPDLAASILIGILIDGMKAVTIRQPDLPRDRLGDMIELLVTRFLGAR
ncbi:MAG: TetR/AcrR family transcriptional regulator [Sphingomonas sp.]|uniref:TetR/AcrR family transcriptional regulator n=1 Tax=Sphingomonas sp. TaxID=28214 RepID=UPI002276E0B3|nr:TetR/AcrR family transcriptional regulator [Sphingomonas sp.]MCX8475360.1 TetR/AcrR family transcriptional regulator [Sphingomonas sp.]